MCCINWITKRQITLFFLSNSALDIVFLFFWSLFLTQVDVYDPTAQQQGDTHPGQDEAVAKVSWSQLSGVLEDFLIV